MPNPNSTSFKIGRRVGRIIGYSLKFGLFPALVFLGIRKRRPINKGFKPYPPKK